MPADILHALHNASTSEASNPYYPLNSSIPNYIPNTHSIFTLLPIFFGTCTLFLLLASHLSKHLRSELSPSENLTILWFTLSGSIHTIFEGYYILNFSDLASQQTLLAQMWKEYALSDSRYLTRNTFVLSVEILTVLFWGPGCFLAAVLIVKRSAWRFPVQMIVSMGQGFGDVLYFVSAALDEAVWELRHCRPEGGYFWVYFVLMNLVWIVVPGVLIYQSLVKMVGAIRDVDTMETAKKQR